MMWRLAHNNVAIADGNITQEEEHILPPLLSLPGNTINRPQLIMMVYTIHVLGVVLDGLWASGLAKFDWKVVAHWATKYSNLVAQQ